MGRKNSKISGESRGRLRSPEGHARLIDRAHRDVKSLRFMGLGQLTGDGTGPLGVRPRRLCPKYGTRLGPYARLTSAPNSIPLNHLAHVPQTCLGERVRPTRKCRAGGSRVGLLPRLTPASRKWEAKAVNRPVGRPASNEFKQVDWHRANRGRIEFGSTRINPPNILIALELMKGRGR